MLDDRIYLCRLYTSILIPITDGKRMYNISCNLKAAYESESKEVVLSLIHIFADAVDSSSCGKYKKQEGTLERGGHCLLYTSYRLLVIPI